MKVLIVTHTYAPDAAPRAFRWTAIAEHWAREGAGVQVITTARGGGPDREIRNGVVVHRVGEGFIGRMQRRTGAGGMSASRASDTGARAAPSLLKRTARTLYDATWRHLFWPDYACLWQRPALARTKSLCGAETFDAVITVSHPFTGHLVGRSLKRVLPGLRWIADIGDPFSLADTVASNNQLLYRGLNKRTEAAVLRECDAVSPRTGCLPCSPRCMQRTTGCGSISSAMLKAARRHLRPIGIGRGRQSSCMGPSRDRRYRRRWQQRTS